MNDSQGNRTSLTSKDLEDIIARAEKSLNRALIIAGTSVGVSILAILTGLFMAYSAIRTAKYNAEIGGANLQVATECQQLAAEVLAELKNCRGLIPQGPYTRNVRGGPEPETFFEIEGHNGQKIPLYLVVDGKPVGDYFPK